MTSGSLSVLQGRGGAEDHFGSEPPLFFGDLNLDQVVNGISGRCSSHEVAPFFFHSLASLGEIRYRQEVFRDLERSEVFDAVSRFCSSMRVVMSDLEQSNKLYNLRQRQRWFIDSAGVYAKAVSAFDRDLRGISLESVGLKNIADHLSRYVDSKDFTSLRSEAEKLQAEFSEVRYNLLIKANKITVTGFDGEEDFGSRVEETFQRFAQVAGRDYRVKYASWPDMNRVEEEILEIVVRMHPGVFEAAAGFSARHSGFIDNILATFDHEVQFYLAYIHQMRELERLGLGFCYPLLSGDKKEFYVSGGFDLALAQKLAREGKAPVRNDYELGPGERIIVVSGPNSGGKTTYARAFGQINYLASLGCPVPARRAELFFCDQIFTHFEREEDLDNLRGKLEDELVRIHGILGKATGRSLVIMNESFGSTARGDAMILGKAVLSQIAELGATCVCVTFIDELSRISQEIVSVVAKVLPDDPGVRTFEMEARPADGQAYASAISDKYRLSYESVMGRMRK